MMLGQKKIDQGFAGILKKNSLKIFLEQKKRNKKISTSPTIIYIKNVNKNLNKATVLRHHHHNLHNKS